MGRPKLKFDDQYVPEPNSGCWLWAGRLDSDGYGAIWGNTRAHRVSYEANVGPIPKGMVVCHKCDTPSCVNPSHLFVGTPKDNNDDKVRKGRHILPNSARRKLTVDDVHMILASNEPCFVLAERLHVTDTTISFIRTGRTWQHIRRPDGYEYKPYRAPGNHTRWADQ